VTKNFSQEEEVMPATGPRYSKEEFSRRGEAIFQRDIRSTVENRDPNDFVAIDIETGEFEVDSDELAAMDRIHKRIPGAQVWLRRVGSRFAHRLGGRRIVKP
jgi:hypothetical protein